MCVCQYVLGIGDQHLSNFMIDLSTGGVVGIDFGHAFGTATQVSRDSSNVWSCSYLDLDDNEREFEHLFPL